MYKTCLVINRRHQYHLTLYTNYSQSPSPPMVTEPQNTTLLPTFGSSGFVYNENQN